MFLFFAAIILAACRFNRPEAGNKPMTTEPPIVEEVTSTLGPISETQIKLLDFHTGRNDYVVSVDDTPREFIVYVPAGYDPALPTPVVYMIHGSNQSGQVMFENTGWAKKADEETILVVYPTSWKYRTTESNRVEDKWNTPGTAKIVKTGTTLKDDVKFMRIILGHLQLTFNVDAHRIFASGFSNGGGFVLTRLIPEMNDVFGAYSTSGAGLIGEAKPADGTSTVHASLFSVLGTNDNKIGENQDIPMPFPIDPNELLNHPSFGPMLEKTTSFLGLEMTSTIERSPDYTKFTFDASTEDAGNEFIFMMVKGLFHVYPSGDNNRLDLNVADLSWEFFLKHIKP